MKYTKALLKLVKMIASDLVEEETRLKKEGKNDEAIGKLNLACDLQNAIHEVELELGLFSKKRAPVIAVSTRENPNNHSGIGEIRVYPSIEEAIRKLAAEGNKLKEAKKIDVVRVGRFSVTWVKWVREDEPSAQAWRFSSISSLKPGFKKVF